MGVFSGLLTLAVAFWFYNTTIKQNQSKAEHEKENGWKSFGLGAAAYFAGYMLGVFFNRTLIYFFPIDVGVGSGLAEASGGNTGALGIFYEFVPLIGGLVAAYFVRIKLLLK